MLPKIILGICAFLASIGSLIPFVDSIPHRALKNNVEQLQNPSFRLPRAVIPFHYKLEIIPILDEIPQFQRFTAPGKATISVNCTETTSSITLHALDLQINEGSVTVTDSKGSSQAIANLGFQLEYDFFDINLVNPLVVGETYAIFIPYTAPIATDRLDGMYLDFYIDPATQETRYVATTLFAANTARRAFPCFDEPDMKAKFDIVLGRADDYNALSNMHLIDTQPMSEIPNWSWDTFATSPNMSTYLVCMIVSDLTYEEALTNDPEAPTHRVYAPYYSIDRGGGKYSANLSATVLSAFESYYNLSYPLQKLDNVALPQFFYNAMENWGLMTFADRVLLYFPGETSDAQKYQLSLTVSHEVSHNFFGNIVTCQWWTYVWLNEGWATFASHLGLQMTYPELRPWEQFVPNIYQVAMDFDSSLGTHPVANEPQTSEDIGGIYDDIAYEKGASLIRMMETFLTEAVLQTGVQRYLKKWQYSVTVQDDLFGTLQDVVQEVNPNLLPSGTTVKDIMDTWTRQAGYPIVTVSQISSTEFVFSQEQFVNNGITSGNETWWIPLTVSVIIGSNPGIQSFWMSKDQKNITYSFAESDVFVVNPGSIGYYRVLYGGSMFSEISAIIQKDHKLFEATTRVKLIDDTFTLASMGKIPIESALELTNYIDTETDYFVWKTLKKHFGNILTRYDHISISDSLKDYILGKLKLAKKEINLLHKNENTIISNMLREYLFEWICELDLSNSDCKPDGNIHKL